MPGRLLPVLCADDFGMDDGVCRGILSLIRLGRVHATSVMSLAPAWTVHAAALREHRRQVRVGLHLDATSAAAALTGVRRAWPMAVARALLGLEDAQAIEHSIAMQLDAFERLWRAPPAHVDGHQHIHQLPIWRDALLTELARRYGPERPALRIARVAQPGLKPALITATGATALELRALAQGWPLMAPLLGVYGFHGGYTRYAQRMRGWLAQAAAQGGVIMCHPALGDNPADPIRTARRIEHAHLISRRHADDWRELVSAKPAAGVLS